MYDNFKRALVDADYLIYHAAWGSKDYPMESHVVLRGMLTDLLNVLKAWTDSVMLVATSKKRSPYLTRTDIYKPALYKGNRIDTAEVALMKEQLRESLMEWCVSVPGLEADDIIAHQAEPNNLIVSHDKDLDNIPGWHYNPRRMDLYQIDEDTAILKLYMQMLTGDKSDNIVGIPNIGPVKASRILAHVPISHPELKVVVLKEYINHYGRDIGMAYFDQTLKVLSPWPAVEPYKADTVLIADILRQL